MTDTIKTATNRLYEIEDLLQFAATDFADLDSRVTAINGRPNSGDRVVITNAKTGKDVSIALNDFEVEALLIRISSMFSRDRCRLHGRGYRWYELNPACTCAAVFSSRLLAHRAAALANRVYTASEAAITLALEIRQNSHLTEDWPAEDQAELDRRERARNRWLQAELKRRRA